MNPRIKQLTKKIDKMLHKVNINKYIPYKDKPAHYKMGKRGTSFAEMPTKTELEVIEAFS